MKTFKNFLSKAKTFFIKLWGYITSGYNKAMVYTAKYPKIVTGVFMAIIVLLLCTGCSTTVKEKVVTVTETVEVKTPVPCEVKDLTCSFEGEQYVPTKKLLECLIIHKRIIEICSGKNSAIPLGTSQEKIQEYLSEEVEKFNAKFNSKK